MTGDTAAEAAPAGRRYLWLVVSGAVIGIPAALAAALFLALIHALEHWLWTDLPEALGHHEPPWYLVIGLPLAGAAIVLAARRFLPGDGGKHPLAGLDPAPTPIRNMPGILVAALASLSFGAVLGPEAPIIALGSAVGLLFTGWLRRGRTEAALVSSAGEFSAISALFGGPIVAGMLLVEGGLALGERLLPALLPGLVAAAIGFLIFVGFGGWGGLDSPGLVVPNLPAYHGTHLYDLFVGLVAGIVTALLLAMVRALGVRVANLAGRFGAPLLLLGGGLAIGLLAQVGSWLGVGARDVLFSGQASIPVLAEADSTKVVLVLLAAKGLAYAVSLGVGFRGGPIFPAIFLGIALASLPVVWFHESPTLAVAIGAAAGMSTQTGLLMSPLIFAALLVGTAGQDTIPAAVIATAAAWLTTRALKKWTDRAASAADRPATSGTAAEPGPA